MGSSPSKPADSQPKEHVFAASTPIRLSPSLEQSLSSSTESDTSRASDLELHIQRRVNAELSRLSSSIDENLREISDRISSNGIPTSPVPESEGLGQDAMALKSEKEKQLSELSRKGVQDEIERLKGKLETKRLKEGVTDDAGVKRAKEKVVQCLRVNDRRPLDCWKEVEGFKKEVGRLEGEWVRGVWER